MGLKRAKLWVGLAALAMLVLSVVTVLADEIIVNGTFDTSDDWTFGSMAEWTDSYDHTDNSGGSVITEPYDDLESCVWQSLPTDPGTMSISGWVRSETEGTGGAVIVIVDNEDFSLIEVSDYNVSTDWRQITGEIVIPGGVISLQLEACNMFSPPSPNIIFDDISVDFQPVEPTPTPTPTPIPPTFNELTNNSIIVYGLITVVLVFSEQIAKIIYVWIWRANK